MSLSARYQKKAERFGFEEPGVCRFLKFYDDGGGDTLTLWRGFSNGDRWQRKVIRYDDILAKHHHSGSFLDLVLRGGQGSAAIQGFNLLALVPLLEKRLVRSVREIDLEELMEVDKAFGCPREEHTEPICIAPFAVFFTCDGLYYDPPENVPLGEVLH